MKLSPLPPPGSRIGVAVSGGADSTALLLQLHRLGEHALAAVHLNHGWRGAESEADAEFCRALAASLQIPFHSRRGGPASPGNLEQAARDERLRFFNELIETRQVDHVATAHTRDDQAETVLFRVLRGASLQGLAGIHPARGRILRPMLGVARAEVVEFLRACGQPWREDASNADTGFRRNRIRHELLPQLRRDWNPELARALAQTAELAWDEQQFWNEHIAGIAARDFTIRGRAATIGAPILAAHPKAVARRLIRWAIERVKGDARQIGLQHVEAALLLAAREGEGHGRLVIPAVDIMRSFEWLRFAPHEPGRDRAAERNAEQSLAIPGEARAADGSRIRAEIAAASEPQPKGNENDTVETSEIACGAAVRSRAVTLRNWRPGDRYRPEGRECAEKLKSMFQRGRVPLWDRATWPIITIGDDQIIWTRKFGPVARGGESAAEEPGNVLRITRFE